MTQVGCATGHMYELVALRQAADISDYPDDTYWRGPVAHACEAAFANYTGRTYSEANQLVVAGRSSMSFRPKPVSWAQGDRTVYCLAHSVAAATGSVRAR